jgi:hypothetical protein
MVFEGGLDIHFPFVWIHKTSSLTFEEISEIEKIVLSEFNEIKPKGFLLLDKPNLDFPFEKWSHNLFGEINTNDFLDESFNLKVAELKCELSQNLTWFNTYVSEFEERLHEKPEINGFVRIGVQGEFEQAAVDGALFLLSDKIGFSGVLAGIDSPLYGLPSLYMIENFLSKRWIGKRMSSPLQAKFFNSLSSRYKFVWGTIYDKNLSSLKAAKRVGRRVIETEYFYSFAH